jgi:hypothetical protein
MKIDIDLTRFAAKLVEELEQHLAPLAQQGVIAQQIRSASVELTRLSIEAYDLGLSVQFEVSDTLIVDPPTTFRRFRNSITPHISRTL